MLDIQGKPWLIEINTNPCLEEPCPWLQQLVPRMLDDALKLTLDVVFHSPRSSDKLEVEGYTADENLWGSKFLKL